MAHEFYVSITGASQGKMKGEGAPKPHEEKIAGLYFKLKGKANFAVEAHPGGARVRHLNAVGHGYEPIVFRKESGAASPQLLSAVANNEMLSTVLFEFIRTRPDGGGEVVFQTIKLTKAFIVRLAQGTFTNNGDARLWEEVGLTFEKIEIENKLAKTMGEDIWDGHGP